MRCAAGADLYGSSIAAAAANPSTAGPSGTLQQANCSTSAGAGPVRADFNPESGADPGFFAADATLGYASGTAAGHLP